MTFRLSRILFASVLALSAGVLAGSALAQSARETGKLPIALQMYTMRDAGPLEDQLKAVNAAGLTAVETFGKIGDLSAPDLKKTLDAHGLKVTSHHSSLADLRSNIQAVIDYAKGIGDDTIVLPYLAPQLRPVDKAGWQALGIELAGYADVLESQGLTFVYHNHNFEMVELDGRTALEILMDAAGPKVKLELDIAWAQRGGQDPAEFLGKFKGRLFSVHTKDNAGIGDTKAGSMGFISVGSGIVDWAKVLPAANDAGAKWYIIEQDDPKDPADAAASIKASAAYLTDHLPVGATR